MSRTLLRSLFSFDPRPTSEVEDEMRAEFDTHLAMLEDELAQQGLDPTTARQQALARFGNPTRLAREGTAIKLGDRIMLQRINLALLLVVGAAVIFLLVHNQRMTSRNMQTMEQLSATIAVLQERTQAAPMFEPAGPPQKLIYLEGLVAMPGAYVIPPEGITLRRAIAAAGGLHPDARSIHLDYGQPDMTDITLSASDDLPTRDDPRLAANDIVTVSSDLYTGIPTFNPETFDLNDSTLLDRLAKQDAPLGRMVSRRSEIKASLEEAAGRWGSDHRDVRSAQVMLKGADTAIRSRIIELSGKLKRAERPNSSSSIPSSEQDLAVRVSISGLVAKPGTYSFAKSASVRDLILQAGGINTDQPLTVMVTRARDGQREGTSISKNALHNPECGNLWVDNGDIVRVSASPEYSTNPVVQPVESPMCYVAGRVHRSGPYAIPKDGVTLMRLLSTCGLRDGATTVTHTRGLNGASHTIEIAKLMKGDAADIPVAGMDAIEVR